MPEKRKPPFLLIFLILSLLLHLLLFWHYRYWQPAAKALEALRKKQAQQIPVQIIDLPKKQKNKPKPAKPPKKPHFLADRNQTVKKETKAEPSAPPPVKVKPRPPVPRPRPQPKPQPQAQPAKPEPKVKVEAQNKTRPPKIKHGIAVPKPARKPARKPRPGKKAARKPIPKPAPPRKVEKPAPKPNKLSKLFPTYDELTKFDRQEEQHRRTAPPGPNRPHIPGKLKRSTTISLNTMSFEYHSYYLALKRKIELVWEYPYEARRRGIQGRLRIHFVINLDGSLAEVKILRSSGSNLLDYEAVRAIKNAAPFPPLPKRMNTRTLTVNATFEYLLSYRSVH